MPSMHVMGFADRQVSAASDSQQLADLFCGDWAVGDVGDGEGYERGDVIPDFGLVDQFGDTVYIRDFCNRTIFIHGAAFW